MSVHLYIVIADEVEGEVVLPLNCVAQKPATGQEDGKVRIVPNHWTCVIVLEETVIRVIS